MDQVAAAGVQLLAAYKKQLDAAKEKVEVARRLATKIEIFEVTIMMIPRRGSTEHFKGEREETKKEDASKPQSNSEQVKNYANEATGFAIETATSMIMDKAKEVLDQTPFGLVADLISFGSGDDQTPIMKDMRAGEILDMMRRNGAKDLEVSFAAMRFIVQSALTIIDDAVKDVKLIEIPNCCWVIQPWKVQAQNTVGERLDGHMDSLDKFNGQLQSAISVASYCISLEQLENVLNATSMLACMELRDFWKRKIGISNIRSKMNEVVESFLDDIQDKVQAYKKEYCHVVEKFVKMKTTPEVALGRFLANMWNSNGDAFITVYELNSNTQAYASKLGKDCKVIQITTETMIALEKLFYSKIVFYPISIDAGKDKVVGTIDDKLVLYDSQKLHENHRVELHPNDMMIVLQPFQRLRILCTLPNFDQDMYPHDCVALMKYEKVNTLPQLVSASEYLLEEVSGTRTFLNQETNEQLYGKDLYKWNAPKTFKNKDPVTGKEKTYKVPGIDGRRLGPNNFEVTKTNVGKETDAEEEEVVATADVSNNANNAVLDSSNATLDKGGVTTTTSILYTPLVSEPGFYTIRLVLDDLELEDYEELRYANKKKLMISNKSYYYNRSVEVNSAFNESTSRGRAFYTKEGLGEDNIVIYYQMALQMLALDEVEAKRVREFSKFAQIQRDRNKIELALSKLTGNETIPASSPAIVPTVVPPATKAVPRVDDGDNVAKKPISPTPTSPSSGGGGVMSAISSFFSSPATNNATAAAASNVAESGANENGITMMSNPLAKRPSTMITTTETTTPVTPAANDAKAIHTRIAILLKDLSKNGPSTNKEFQAYLNTVTKALPTSIKSNDIAQVRVLEKTEIVLRRLQLSLQLRGVIEKVSLYIDDLQDKWFESMMQLPKIAEVKAQSKIKNGENELLKQVDESLRQYRGLMQIQRSLLPAELQGSLSMTSTTSTKHHLPMQLIKPSSDGKDAKEADSRYLVDFAADKAAVAKSCLENLFAQYYIVKMSVYELDSKESMWQRNVRRLELLTSKMADLKQSIVEEPATVNPSPVATSAAAGPGANSAQPPTAPAATGGGAKRRTSLAPTSNVPALTAEQVFEKHASHRKNHPITYRTDVLKHIDSLVMEIELMIDNLFSEASDPKKKGQMSQIVKRAEQCDQIITELKAIREMALYLPPSSSPTLEEELQFSRHSTKPPLGLIIQVEDSNAIAWGEAEPDLSDDEYDNDEEVEGKDKAKTKYRPVIEYNYPYHTKNTIRSNIASVDFSTPSAEEGQGHHHQNAHKEKLETAVFFNIATVSNAATKKKKEEDGEKKEVPLKSTLTPTHIAIFAKNKSYKDDTHPKHLELLECVEIENKTDRYVMVDFYSSVRNIVSRIAPDFDYENVEIDVDLKIILVANVNAAQVEAAAKEEIQTWTLTTPSKSGEATTNEKVYAFLEGCPILTYNIYEDAAYDSDEEDEDDYDYDEDDDEEGDDYDDSDELEVAYDQAADVERVHSKLHKYHLHCHNENVNHVMELCHTDTLYEGSMYIYCDICERRANGHIYHCIECGNYDAHPQCVVDEFYNLDEANDVVQMAEGVDPLQLDKKGMAGYVDEEEYRARLANASNDDSDEESEANNEQGAVEGTEQDDEKSAVEGEAADGNEGGSEEEGDGEEGGDEDGSEEDGEEE